MSGYLKEDYIHRIISLVLAVPIEDLLVRCSIPKFCGLRIVEKQIFC